MTVTEGQHKLLYGGTE